MTCGYTQVSEEDSFSIVDLDDVYVTETEFIDQYINKNGTLWTWGHNINGQLGLGDRTSNSSPVQVGTLTNWKQISGGHWSALTIKTDGTLWSWGRNQFGESGHSDVTQRSSPVQVGSLTNWKYITGDFKSNAIKTDGTLWSWGYNGYGGLGLGDITNRSSPVQVGSLTNWKYVSTNVNYLNTCAIKTDGTLWSCGYNGYGELGLGDITHRSSPVQVGSLTNWKYVSASDGYMIAVKTDGTLWVWGYNGVGQLGLGNTTSYSSPVQVGSLTNWKYASTGYQYTLAIKTNGTLWSWGVNNSGQLGLNDITAINSPVQVGSLTNWKQVSISNSADSNYNSVLAIKTDGTLWSWGNNTYGQLGHNDKTHRSSPVQVGSLTNWKYVSAGDMYTLAIQQ